MAKAEGKTLWPTLGTVGPPLGFARSLPSRHEPTIRWLSLLVGHSPKVSASL